MITFIGMLPTETRKQDATQRWLKRAIKPIHDMPPRKRSTRCRVLSFWML